jgi:hypothetical protein
VIGTQPEWIRALGPDGSLAELDVRGDRGLAETLLGSFTRAASARARPVA